MENLVYIYINGMKIDKTSSWSYKTSNIVDPEPKPETPTPEEPNNPTPDIPENPEDNNQTETPEENGGGEENNE